MKASRSTCYHRSLLHILSMAYMQVPNFMINLGISRAGPGFTKPELEIPSPGLAWPDNKKRKFRPEPGPNGLKR